MASMLSPSVREHGRLSNGCAVGCRHVAFADAATAGECRDSHRGGPMPVTITSAATSPVLNVLGEELRPLTPAGQGLSVEGFDTSAPGEGPGAGGPPPHRHPWDEIYVVLNGILEVFDGEAWREAPAGACVTVPAFQWHAY